MTGFRSTRVAVSATLNAPRPRVWRALVRETSRWWPREFLVNPRSRRFVIEPRVGGRVYEDAGGGAGYEWYRVVAVDPPKSLVLQGLLGPSHFGPAITSAWFTLEEARGGTKVTVTEISFGAVRRGLEKALKEGWNLLLGKALRGHVER